LPFHKAVAELEKTLITEALRASKGNKTEAADRLQINRRLLYKKMTDYDYNDVFERHNIVSSEDIRQALVKVGQYARAQERRAKGA
jgi:regulatory Fis family protein